MGLDSEETWIGLGYVRVAYRPYYLGFFSIMIRQEMFLLISPGDFIKPDMANCLAESTRRQELSLNLELPSYDIA